MRPLSHRLKNLHVRLAMLLGRRWQAAFAHRLRNPVFVVGTARSGTTLLAWLLGDRPEVAEWSEANQLWDPSWFPWTPEMAEEPPFELDPRAFTERWWRENRGRGREIRASFGAFQSLAGRPVFVNKSPFHTFRVRQVLELFPEARFVHVVRDGRAVVLSYARHLLARGKLREWPAEWRQRVERSPEPLYELLAHLWCESLCEVDGAARDLGLAADGKMLRLRYEDLAEDPDGTVSGLDSFLGLTAGRSLRRQIASRNYKWRQAFSPETLARLESIMGPHLEADGYRPSGEAT